MADNQQHNRQGNQQGSHQINQQSNQQKSNIDTVKPSFDLDQLKNENEKVITPSPPVKSKSEEEDMDQTKPLIATYYDFKGILVILVAQVLEGQISSQQSKILLHKWYRSMTPEQKDEFIAKRNASDDTINYFKGVVDTLAQELPYLLTS